MSVFVLLLYVFVVFVYVVLCCVVEKFLVTPDPSSYHFINQGSLTVDNLDDQEEMQITDVRVTWLQQP